MTDLRQAAQMALEALASYSIGERLDASQVNDLIAFVANWKAAQQQAEPWGWYSAKADDFMTHSIRKEHERLGSYTHINGKFDLPLYTSPQQQAESVSMRMPKVGDRIVCLEDESLGKVVSLTAGGSPDIKFDDGSHGTYLLREFAELFSYVAPPQRKWQGLTDEDWAEVADMTDTFDQGVAWAAARLKERNT